MNYILDEHDNPKATNDILEWARWFEEAERRVAYDALPGDVEVSTVFLAVDHNFGSGAPILYETMIFRDGDGSEQWRYSTRQEAQEGHAAVVAALREGREPYLCFD